MERTSNIITFAQFGEGNLLPETRNDTKSGDKSGDESDDNSTMPPLLSEEGNVCQVFWR